MIEGKLGEMDRNPRTVQVCTDSPVPGGGSGIAVIGQIKFALGFNKNYADSSIENDECTASLVMQSKLVGWQTHTT